MFLVHTGSWLFHPDHQSRSSFLGVSGTSSAVHPVDPGHQSWARAVANEHKIVGVKRPAAGWREGHLIWIWTIIAAINSQCTQWLSVLRTIICSLFCLLQLTTPRSAELWYCQNQKLWNSFLVWFSHSVFSGGFHCSAISEFAIDYDLSEGSWWSIFICDWKQN